MKAMPRLSGGDALLIVDVQRDFCPGGALPIEHGDQVVGVLNEWIQEATRQNAAVYFSRDWHPRVHLSFLEQGGQWPSHCIQDTDGAAFHPELALPENAVIITKGTRFDQDQYSAFDQTGLAVELSRRGVKHLWIGGLALDVCVRATALDARKAGLEVSLIRDGTRPVTSEGGTAAIEEMRNAGVRIPE